MGHCWIDPGRALQRSAGGAVVVERVRRDVVAGLVGKCVPPAVSVLNCEAFDCTSNLDADGLRQLAPFGTAGIGVVRPDVRSGSRGFGVRARGWRGGWGQRGWRWRWGRLLSWSDGCAAVASALPACRATTLQRRADRSGLAGAARGLQVVARAGLASLEVGSALVAALLGLAATGYTDCQRRSN